MREFMLVLHFIGLAMGLGTSFAFMFLGMAASKMEAAKRSEFMLNGLAISRMGHIGLGLLIISGGYLMTPYWSILTEMPLLMTKLGLVIVLGALIGIISSRARKAAQGDVEANLKKIVPFGRISLITTLTIVTLAVLIFR